MRKKQNKDIAKFKKKFKNKNKFWVVFIINFKMKQKIAISMGDANGISAEIIAKNLGKKEKLSFLPVIFGDLSIFQKWEKILKKQKNYKEPYFDYFFEKIAKKEIHFAEIAKNTLFKPAVATKESGILSFACLETAIKETLTGKTKALVTAPIHKNSFALAKIPYKDHTSALLKLTKTKNYAMAFCSNAYWLLLVTDHIPLNLVASSLNSVMILEKITLAWNMLLSLDKKNPKIGICGFNPHAGENGILGSEEQEIILPAIEKARKQGINISDPLPADTIFYRANRLEFDLVIAMYHDQGLAPFKSCFFEESAQVTLGLPIIRTSVSHGTAYNIAGKNIASELSLNYSLKTAQKLTKHF